MTPTMVLRLVVVGILIAYGIGFGAYFVYTVRGVLLVLFVAWLVATALDTPVAWLSRRLPRGLAILVCYVVLILAMVGLGSLVLPPLIAQSRDLLFDFPTYADHAESFLGGWQAWLHEHGVDVDWRQEALRLTQYADEALLAVFRLPLAAFSAALSALAVLVLALYWLLERDTALAWLIDLFWPNCPERAARLLTRAETRLGAYVRGLAVLALAVGAATYVGLLVLRVPYALPLAVIAGLLALLPTIGPIISAIPAVIIAATQSPTLALLTAGLYLLVQQLENYLLVPRIHQAAVGLNPLAVLIAVLCGAAFAGIAGAILAVPVAALLGLAANEVRASRRARLEPRPPDSV
ncbi:MAG: AI-2E family transporter [Chloroflexi bacterium]|nr:AI-2E family transporter [Chloroflexota bacterium]